MCGQRQRLDPGVQELLSGLAWKIVARFCSLYLCRRTIPCHRFLSWLLPLCSSRSLCRSVVVMRRRVFASEACFTLGSHSSMVKLVVPLGVWGGCRHLHALRRRSVVQVVSLVRAFLEYLAIDNFWYVSAPGRLAAEGRWQWRSSPVALTPHAGGSHFRCPCTPVHLRSSELPATTVGESSRGGSLRRHKAGPVTVHFVFNCFLSVLVSFEGCCSSCGQGRKGVQAAGATPLVPRRGGR